MPSNNPTLGALLRGLRAREGWTLKEMSAKSGIPVSTLSKIEHDQLTLGYDRLIELGRRLGLGIADRFGLVALIGSGYRYLAYVILAVYIVPLLTIGVRMLVLGSRRRAAEALDSSPASL